MQTDGQGAVDMSIVIKKVDDETNVIEFSRKKGLIMGFFQTVEEKFKAPFDKLMSEVFKEEK